MPSSNNTGNFITAEYGTENLKFNTDLGSANPAFAGIGGTAGPSSTNLDFKTVSGKTQLTLANITNAVNNVQISGSAAGNATVVESIGSDTNVSFTTKAKGNGNITFMNAFGINCEILSQSTTTANYLRLQAVAAGVSPLLQVLGTDAAANLRLRTLGTGSFVFETGSNGNIQLQITNITTAVNYINVTGAVTTGSPVVSAQGTDTNIDLTLNPKGTGLLKIGTAYTSGVAAQTGYITVKDSTGTTYKLLCAT